ncbi:MAG: hypothetical protein U0736_14665 [Gemmataceae bacterium]
MRPLTFAVVLVAATGIGVGFRVAVSGDSHAAHRVRPAVDEDRILLPDEAPVDGWIPPPAVTPAHADSLPELATTLEEQEPDEATLARVAARCGDHLLTLARRHPDRVVYLRQAEQHYQACLAHESTVRDAGGLFTTVRARLAEIETLRQKPKPAVAKPTPAPSVAAKPSAPPPTPVPPVAAARPTAPMVGPDGVPIERAAPVR